MANHLSFTLICVMSALAGHTQNIAPAPLHSAPIELSYDRPFVMVKINDRGPYRFLVDTGTSTAAIVSVALAGELHLGGTGHSTLQDLSGQGNQTVPIVRIDKLTLAGFDFHGVRAIVHRLGDDYGHYDGILGFSLFRDHLLTLDYPKRRISISTGALDGENDSSVIPFYLDHQIPMVTLQVGDVKAGALLDSGGVALSLPERLAAHFKFLSQPHEYAISHTLTNKFSVRVGQLSSNVRLGVYKFEHPYIETDSLCPIAILGSSAMQDFAVTFDQKTMRVRFAWDHKPLKLLASPVAFESELYGTRFHAVTMLFPDE